MGGGGGWSGGRRWRDVVDSPAAGVYAPRGLRASCRRAHGSTRRGPRRHPAQRRPCSLRAEPRRRAASLFSRAALRSTCLLHIHPTAARLDLPATCPTHRPLLAPSPPLLASAQPDIHATGFYPPPLAPDPSSTGLPGRWPAAARPYARIPAQPRSESPIARQPATHAPAPHVTPKACALPRAAAPSQGAANSRPSG